MSLDVTLSVPDSATGEARERIFVRDAGETREVTREEWDALFPGRAPTVVLDPGDRDEVYTANITHNLARMADHAAGNLYDVLWAPAASGITHARDLTESLREGLEDLRRRPDYFREFNPENGWGDYDLLVRFVERYLEACERWPDAEVEVSR